jgi:hypothetical protein
MPARLIAAAAGVTVLLAGCGTPPMTLGPSPQPPPSTTAPTALPRSTTAPVPSTRPPALAPKAVTPGLAHFHDPGKVTYSKGISYCAARDLGQLPSPFCTPGSTDPAVTQADIGSTICRTGWTATVRPPSSETGHAKFAVAYPAYGMPVTVTSELDHLVPIELGGSNDITNLWPEAGKVPNPKDAVENALRAAVCAHKVTLRAAQDAIARDWMTAEAVLHV